MFPFCCLLVWSHSSRKCPCLFRLVVFQYFHLYFVSYFVLIRVFVMSLFSVTVQQCVMSSLLHFQERKFVLVKLDTSDLRLRL